MNPVTTLLALALGGLTWLLAEYLIHRFLGHGRKARLDFGREHTRHHSLGDYFAPTSKKVGAALQASALLSLITVPFVGLYGVVYTVGFVLVYGLYELVHRRAHTHPPTGPYGRWMRKNHFYHHFENPKANHGVTTPLGDVIFRTGVRPQRIRVPRRLAMSWLVDPASGEIHDAYRDDYVLR